MFRLQLTTLEDLNEENVEIAKIKFPLIRLLSHSLLREDQDLRGCLSKTVPEETQLAGSVLTTFPFAYHFGTKFDSWFFASAS